MSFSDLLQFDALRIFNLTLAKTLPGHGSNPKQVSSSLNSCTSSYIGMRYYPMFRRGVVDVALTDRLHISGKSAKKSFNISPKSTSPSFKTCTLRLPRAMAISSIHHTLHLPTEVRDTTYKLVLTCSTRIVLRPQKREQRRRSTLLSGRPLRPTTEEEDDRKVLEKDAHSSRFCLLDARSIMRRCRIIIAQIRSTLRMPTFWRSLWRRSVRSVGRRLRYWIWR